MSNIFITIFKRAQKCTATYFNAGVVDLDDAEAVRKAYLVNSFIFLGIIFVLPLGINAIVKEIYILAFCLLLISIILFVTYAYLKVSYDQRTPAYVVSTIFFLLMLYLVNTGGVNNTGPLWIYILPMVLMFLLGFKNGMLYSFLFISVLSIMLFSGSPYLLHAEYTFSFKLRMILSLTVVIFLAASYEYLRERTFETVLSLSKALNEASLRDPMTNLYNRRGLYKIADEVCEAHQSKSNVLALILCDIDFFKKINDTYGHNVGDDVLKEVAKEIREIVEEGDVVARWGGEEFLILLPNTSMVGAYVRAENLRAKIATLDFQAEGEKIDVTVSLGLSVQKANGDIEDSIRKADAQMYEAKQNGRNRVYPLFRTF